jgi:plasmid replication initiation protein
MRHRWVAGALLEIERKMRRINNYDKLHLLRNVVKTELKLEQISVA